LGGLCHSRAVRSEGDAEPQIDRNSDRDTRRDHPGSLYICISFPKAETNKRTLGTIKHLCRRGSRLMKALLTDESDE
jgi:hypothetical protein